MQSTIKSKKLWYYTFAGLCILIALYPSIYFIIEDQPGILASKSTELQSDYIWKSAFFGHISFGGLALLIGWLQFSNQLRKSRPSIHKNIGKAYICFALLSGMCGLYLSFFATGGLIPALGFGSLAVVWLVTTSGGFLAVKKGDYDKHERLMIYSFSACFAAVSLRIWLPLLIFVCGDFIMAYSIVAWLCWVPNLFIAYKFNN